MKEQGTMMHSGEMTETLLHTLSLLRQVCAGRGSMSTPKGCLGFMVISLLLEADTLV